MNEPTGATRTPTTVRGKILLFVWRQLPRLFLLVIILFIIALAGKCSSEKTRLEQEKAAGKGQVEKPVNAVLLNLQPTTIQDAINLPGMIEPWTRLELMAKVDGSISEVLVQEGSTVKEGDILARIESDDYRIALDSAKASYTQARLDYERKKALLSKNISTRADLELSESQMLTAKAAMEDAELQLSRSTITAPMDGIIRRLDAKIGLLLRIGDPIAEILQIDRVKAVVGIPESDVDAVRKISGVNITIQALDNLEVRGTRYFLSPAPESTARLYRLELEVDNRDNAILPGMFFRAHVLKKTIEEAITIPIYTVITRNEEQFVFVADADGIVHKRPVKLGILEKWQVQITEGLQADDMIVIEGHRDIEDGQQVNVIKTVTDPDSLQL
ncbi:MAG: efflux RND transporter periplasmic adaptor subunit [Desulfobulbaceae bacterium]|nr:efflux RND transporter periplasmic adaptor subunit [Desulfobulbaceae bacterium]